jgi:branched-chain amino acid transport system ATP-binding protein
MLTITDVSAGYGNVEVLHGATLTMNRGDRVGLFGPNGHGKTTLLRTISGLVRARSGSIEFDGRSLVGCSPKEIVDLGIVHVPQGNTLFPRMTVLECLSLGAYTSRTWATRKSSLDQVFALFPKLKQRLAQQVQSLSGGERQMLSIGVGLMTMPTLFMLDEPSLGLAPRLIEELSQGIAKIAETGVTLLLVDQNVEMLLDCCGPLFLLEQGRISLEAADADEFDEERLLRRYFGTVA